MKTLFIRKNHIAIQEKTKDLCRVPFCIFVHPSLEALETVCAALAKILPWKLIYSPGQTHFLYKRFGEFYRFVRRPSIAEDDAVNPRTYGSEQATNISFLVFDHGKKDNFHWRRGHSVCVPGFIGLKKSHLRPAPTKQVLPCNKNGIPVR
jgi:hypothetical protein